MEQEENYKSPIGILAAAGYSVSKKGIILEGNKTIRVFCWRDISCISQYSENIREHHGMESKLVCVYYISINVNKENSTTIKFTNEIDADSVLNYLRLRFLNYFTDKKNEKVDRIFKIEF